jgi:hypothetical protein
MTAARWIGATALAIGGFLFGAFALLGLLLRSSSFCEDSGACFRGHPVQATLEGLLAVGAVTCAWVACAKLLRGRSRRSILWLLASALVLLAAWGALVQPKIHYLF